MNCWATFKRPLRGVKPNIDSGMLRNPKWRLQTCQTAASFARNKAYGGNYFAPSGREFLLINTRGVAPVYYISRLQREDLVEILMRYDTPSLTAASRCALCPKRFQRDDGHALPNGRATTPCP